MARLAIATAGAVVGFYATGGNPAGAAAGWSLGMAAGGLLFPEDGPRVEGPRLDDLSVHGSSYGLPIPIFYGMYRAAGNIVWSPGLIETQLEESVGGKGGPSATNVSYIYTASFMAMLGEGPIAGVTRIWADSKLIYDARATNTDPPSKYFEHIRFYLGTETQEPDATYEADVGTANAPAYRGRAYIMFDALPLADFGNRIPSISAEINGAVTDGFPSVQIASSPSVPSKLVWSWDRRFIVGVVGEAVVKIDTLNNRLLYGTDASGGNLFGSALHEVGPDGSIYTGEGNALAGTVYRLNGNTYTREASAAIDGVPTHFLLSALTTATGDSAAMTLAVVVGGQIRLFDRLDLSAVETVDLGGDYGPNVSVTDMARHPLGTFWVVGRNTATDELHIWRVDPLGDVIGHWTEAGLATATVRCFYDASFDALFIGVDDSGDLIKWDVASESVDSTLAAAYSSTSNPAIVFKAGPTPGGTWWFATGIGSAVREIDLSTMTLKRSVTLLDWSSERFSENCLYDEKAHGLIGLEFGAGGYRKILLDRVSGTPTTTTYQAVVEDISDRVGLASGEYDASALTDVLSGYAVTKPMAARQAIEPLMNALLFDAVESDGKVKFIKRGSASSASIPEEDLAAHFPGQQMPAPIEIVRAQEAELPARIDILYINQDTDYQNAAAGARRIAEAITTTDKRTVNLPIVFTGSEPKKIAERALYFAWLRERYAVQLGPKWLKLDPGDVVTITNNSVAHTVLITEVDITAGYVVKVQGMADAQAVYTSNATAQAMTVTSELRTDHGTTETYLMDIPLLQDLDEGPGFYLAAAGYDEDDWPGAIVYRSSDETDWNEFALVASSERATAGFAVNALATTDQWPMWDETNTLTVLLTSGDTLTSATKLQVYNGSNAALLGDEIIQWREASQNADGSWALSGLLRARRGTETAVSTHSAGERFVVLTEATIRRPPATLDQINLARFYRGVTIGQSVLDGVTQAFTNTAVGLKPYSPANIEGSRDGSNNLTVTWNRRSRIGGGWRDYVDVPLGETSESYEVDILDNVGSPTDAVLRTITAGSETASYTAAQQTTDGLTPGQQVKVKIYQLSETVGRGFGREATI